MLHDVSLTIPAGQMVGIVGPSGSGKSTLAKLVQRLYVPESGRVLVDGVDLAMVDIAGCAARSAWCCRRTCCSTARSATTSRWPIPACAIERVIAAAKLAGAHDFILELPEGYDTIVGERGAPSRADSASASPSPAR